MRDHEREAVTIVVSSKSIVTRSNCTSLSAANSGTAEKQSYLHRWSWMTFVSVSGDFQLIKDGTWMTFKSASTKIRSVV